MLTHQDEIKSMYFFPSISIKISSLASVITIGSYSASILVKGCHKKSLSFFLSYFFHSFYAQKFCKIINTFPSYFFTFGTIPIILILFFKILSPNNFIVLIVFSRLLPINTIPQKLIFFLL